MLRRRLARILTAIAYLAMRAASGVTAGEYHYDKQALDAISERRRELRIKRFK